MSEQIIAKTIQNDFNRLKYQPGKDFCACGVCSIFTNVRGCESVDGIRDYEIFDHPDSECCGGLCVRQPVCSRADPLSCNIGLGKNGENPLIKYGWDNKAPNIKCIFDLRKINTKEQLNNFNNKFGIDNNVEAHYCTQKVNSCVPGVKECSRLFSIGEGSTECNNWFENLSSENQDAVMNNYCRTYNTSECKCVNRFNENSYKAMKGYKSFNDGCWYSPCIDENKNFIPSHLKNPTCPDKICQQLYEFINDQNINVDNIKEDINCDFSNVPHNQTHVNGSNVNGSSKDNMKYIFIIIIIIAIIMFAYFFRSK